MRVLFNALYYLEGFTEMLLQTNSDSDQVL